jgi:hypothetical protein
MEQNTFGKTFNRFVDTSTKNLIADALSLRKVGFFDRNCKIEHVDPQQIPQIINNYIDKDF